MKTIQRFQKSKGPIPYRPTLPLLLLLLLLIVYLYNNILKKTLAVKNWIAVLNLQFDSEYNKKIVKYNL